MVQSLCHPVVDQYRDGVEDTIPTHLLPFAFTDIVADLAGNAGLLEDSRNLQKPLALVSHEFADCHPAALIVLDDAWLDDLRIDEGHAADDAIALHSLNNPIFRINAVLEREDNRALGHHRLELRHDL